MQVWKLVFAAALTGGLAMAQRAPQPDKLFTSAADIQAMIAKAKAERKDQAMIGSNIVRSTTHSAGLEYRAAVGPASTHMKEAEMFYVIEGSGTLVTGGKLANEKVNGDNSSGTAIEGGDSRKVAKGDFIMVPEGTPHWFSAIDGTLVLMSVHLPQTAK
jgi:mannose-6-phosphate isomerase-like protein (cupin superfamily)